MELQIWLCLISHCIDILGGDTHIPGRHLLPCQNLLAKAGNIMPLQSQHATLLFQQNYPDVTSEDLHVRSRFFFSNPRRYESVEGDSFPYQRSV